MKLINKIILLAIISLFIALISCAKKPPPPPLEPEPTREEVQDSLDTNLEGNPPERGGTVTTTNN